MEVALEGTSGMNSGGNAAVVKVYQLKGSGTFTQVPVSSFWKDDKGALGGDLLARPRAVTLYPSDSTTIEFSLVEKAQYIGVAANLRNPDREAWRSVHALNDMGDFVSVTVEETQVAVEVEDRSLLDRVMGLL
jgi:type VI secretion system VasD/TssJ family lipoprotein